MPEDEADVAILEEPEHLNWFRVPGDDTTHELGWAYKFKHVVGVLHTNYGAYIQQYGMGTSFVTAPALNALSALVVRAYCHRIVRLSAALTSLEPSMEVTSNVHGVRSEFLDPPQKEKHEDTKAPVYFVGKLIWAKGFDKILEVQELYKEATGAYFAMDVYGGGQDMKAIQRGFFGRQGMASDDEYSSDGALSPSSSTDNLRAKDVFAQEVNLRTQVEVSSSRELRDESEGDATEGEEPPSTPKEEEKPDTVTDVINDLSKKTLQTGTETAGAAVRLVESIMEAGIGAFGGTDEKREQKAVKRNHNHFKFRSRFKWRRTPIPARFLGVQDHAIVRDLPEQKIFLNMSTTEVLCTTSAEALAMGKYVVLPKHPSNEFFYQFPNCLAYEDLDDCVTKLQYALKHTPEPVTDKYRHMLSWEGATERLYRASGIRVQDADERQRSGLDQNYLKAAKFHMETAKKSHFVANLGKNLKKAVSSMSNMTEKGKEVKN